MSLLSISLCIESVPESSSELTDGMSDRNVTWLKPESEWREIDGSCLARISVLDNKPHS